MKRISKLALLFIVLILTGCASPSVTTPKPDIRPIQVSHEKARASVGRTRELVTKLRKSQENESRAVDQAVAALNRFTGASKAVDDARAALGTVRQELNQSQQYREWAAQELENAWAYEAQLSTQLVTLGRDIEASHKNEQALADWKAKNEPVIKEVNKWFGLGAILYGVKKLLKWTIFGTLVLAAIGVLLWFFVPAVVPFIRMIMSFIGRIFRSITSILRR